MMPILKSLNTSRGDIDSLTEKLASVANAVEKSSDNTVSIIKGMRVLSLMPDRLNSGLGGLDKTWNNTESLLKGIMCLELKVDTIQENQVGEANQGASGQLQRTREKEPVLLL